MPLKTIKPDCPLKAVFILVLNHTIRGRNPLLSPYEAQTPGTKITLQSVLAFNRIKRSQ